MGEHLIEIKLNTVLYIHVIVIRNKQYFFESFCLGSYVLTVERLTTKNSGFLPQILEAKPSPDIHLMTLE